MILSIKRGSILGSYSPLPTKKKVRSSLFGVILVPDTDQLKKISTSPAIIFHMQLQLLILIRLLTSIYWAPVYQVPCQVFPNVCVANMITTKSTLYYLNRENNTWDYRGSLNSKLMQLVKCWRSVWIQSPRLYLFYSTIFSSILKKTLLCSEIIRTLKSTERKKLRAEDKDVSRHVYTAKAIWVKKHIWGEKKKKHIWKDFFSPHCWAWFLLLLAFLGT